MKNKITIIILGIVLISFANAMYSGECKNINLTELENLDNLVYTVVGNTSNLNGLTININKSDKIAKVCTVKNYAPDNFTIIFLNNLTQEKIKEVYLGGGSTKKVYEDRNITIYKDREIIKNICEEKVIEDYKKNGNKTIEYPILNQDKKNKFLDYLNYLALISLLGMAIFYMIKTYKSDKKIINESEENVNFDGLNNLYL